MPEPGILRYKNYLIVAFLVILALFVLWIRLLPAIMAAPNTDILSMVGSDDPLYNLRQIEQMIQNYPNYSWFEAMTLYPTGQIIHWGPLFIWIISTLCLVTGATTRPEIIGLALVVPPVMAAIMVPLIFLLVRKISDTITGLFAAFFIAVVSGQYFFRALYGYLDHHIAEVLFGTLFSLCVIWALVYMRSHPVDFSRKETLKIPILLSAACGVSYVLGLLVMPTMMLFALIMALYTFLQFIWDFFRRVRGDSLLLLNAVTFGIAALSFLIIGIPKEGLQLDYYTLGHPITYLLIIVVTAILYALSRFFWDRGSTQYLAGLAALVVGGNVAFAFALPQLFNTYLASINQFFGQNTLYLTIQEARSWTAAEAWDTFGIGLILVTLGLVVLGYRLWKEKKGELLFTFILCVFLLFSTWQHIRYEYFVSMTIAILSALFCGMVLQWGWQDVLDLFAKRPKTKEKAPEEQKEKGKKKSRKPEKTKTTVRKANYLGVGGVGLVLVLALLFGFFQVSYEYAVASSGGLRMNQDWKESLEWMESNTPETGVDYYTIYRNDSFQYPDQSYGVMSWWDYGHMITYIAKRIPNANPFQSGVDGKYGAAAFFMSESEDVTGEIADVKGVKYVITDIEMDVSKFWAMATWYDTSKGAAPYHRDYLIEQQGQPGSYSRITLYDSPYFRTTISKLHNFDGSMTSAGEVYYVEYTDTAAALPVVTRAQVMEVTAARAAAEEYNRNPPVGYHAAVLTPTIISPLEPIPALQHFRLVHESPTNVFSTSAPDIRYVKVFEYVPGARISGEGVIEIDLVTDTGRRFTYRQESKDGEFVVPYSTSGSPYEVKAAGRYRIAGTGMEFDVSEEAVTQGLQVR